MDGTISETAAIACSLDAGNFKERLAWIAALNRRALLDARRDGLRLELTYALHALKDAHELVRREQHCCAFLTFDLRVGDNAVRLVVTASEEAREAAELVFESLWSKGTIASAVSCGCGPRRTQ